MEMVRYAINKGKALGLKIWLYDEDRFPSGSAGGKVTVDEKYRQRYLLLSDTFEGDGSKALSWKIQYYSGK